MSENEISADKMQKEIEKWVKEKPWMALLLAVVIGVLLGSLMKRRR